MTAPFVGGCIDGQSWFSFHTPGENDKNFRVSGPNEATLTFRGTHRNQHGSLFGFMLLTLPEGLSAGEQLRLTVSAENADLQQWYMTFEHPVINQIAANNVYGFAEELGIRRQLVVVDVENAGLEEDVDLGLH